ncbi:MAG TPA: hypothetical protein VKU91_08335, partial [Acidimicrobiales bacterium]|nr:hypothetical protein [Acidimicrobiales bacterium]
TVWSGGTARRYRLVTGTAGDPHVLVAPAATPGAAGVPPRIDRLEISGGGWQRGTGEVSVHFYAVPLAGWARQGPEP